MGSVVAAGLTRREVMRRLGTAAAVALPIDELAQVAPLLRRTGAGALARWRPRETPLAWRSGPGPTCSSGSESGSCRSTQHHLVNDRPEEEAHQLLLSPEALRGGRAVSVLSLDTPISDLVLAELWALSSIRSARLVWL
jgi:hypothetical protein